ncbi:hypothetical protein Aduo_003774 [Ancylostoma duodenale]
MKVTMEGETKPVAFHVGEGLDDIIILGTNALKVFGLRLGRVPQAESEEGRFIHGESTSEEARVHERMFLSPGCMKFLPVEVTSKQTDVFFESENAALAPGVCKISTEGIVQLPVVNVGDQPMVFRKGEVDGSWKNENYVPRAALEEQADMVEKQPKEAIDSHERKQALMELISQGSSMTAELGEFV